MVYTKVGPFVDGGPPYLSAVDLNRIEGGIVDATAHLLAGTGIDPTGATNSTAAVQTFLNTVPDGSTVTVPNGAILAVGNLTISKRIRFTGPGEIRFSYATNATPLLSVTVDGVHLDATYLTNPAAVQTYGVYVTANIFRATGNRIVGFQDGLQIAPTGEWHDIVIANNEVLDIIGSGLGPGNATANGENSGDGIVCWGAAATITGNRVTCKTGSDARIGIHVEGLASQEGTPYGNADSLAAISGNTVTGKFRRGIVSESVAHVTITGNTIADSTWWGIALIGLASHCTVSGNTIKYTRTSADTQGSFSSPAQAGIMLYCIQAPLVNTVIANNVIRATPGSVMPAGIVLQADSSVASNGATGVQIIGNVINDEAGQMGTGVNITAATTDVRIVNNYVGTFTATGISAYTCQQIEVVGNKLNGPGAGANIRGVFLNGGANEARVDSNTIRDVGVGIGAQFRAVMTTVNNNWVKNATTGIDMYSSTGVAAVNSNTFSNVTTHTTNLPTGTTTVGNN